MKLETFFEKFELLAEAPNGVQKLRELILQLAVQGKLVPQDPNDESASILLDKIQFEKELLIKEGKIKRNKQLSLINKENIPFNLPLTWEWSNINDITFLITDGEHATPPRIITPEIPLVTAKNVRDGYLELTNTDFVSYATAAKCWQRCEPMHNDILMVCVGATTGRLCLLKQPPKFVMVRSVSLIRPFENYIYPEYIAVAIKSPFGQSQIWSKVKQSAQPCLYINKIQSLAISIPPLAEQKRIVAKVDQLMSLCDELEERQQKKRETRALLNNVAINQLLTAHEPDTFAKHWQRICNNFDLLYSTPENIGKLRQAILQLSIMGKLIPQDSNDEPASVLLDKIRFEKEQLVKEGKIGKPKKLPSINLDEISYQLPKSWQWIRLAQIISLMDAGWSPACKTHPTQSDIQWGVLKTTAVQELEYKQDEHKELPEDLTPRPEYEVKQKDILITRAGPKNRVGICCLVQNTRPRLMISDKIIRFHLIDKYVFPNFIALCLNSGFSKSFIEVQKSGMAASQMNISQDKLKMVPVPIPPLAEQKRIVTKVDQLMDICNKLEAKLTQSQNDSEKLMDVAVRQLLSL